MLSSKNVAKPEQGGAGFANAVAKSSLETRGADCPDAIIGPGYYAQSVASGEPGEIIILEHAAPAEYFVN